MKAHNTTLMHHIFQQKMQWITYGVFRYENTFPYLLCMPELNSNLSFEYYIEVYHQGGGIMDLYLEECIDGWSKASLLGNQLIRISLSLWISL